ncbi:MAG: polymer-forming cytoskeletal protein [Lachnospiraceae bacterium]|nr:polymer-forming cytoskeletal protein [Lachnospiraceae bacterium]MBR4993712.1 polymer-forming cytoskeletal protein [Lachnospiraceae bacterium]MBR5943948.1 polymer-forming cytoskeletal protein [Lachnospiraceae bacterium]
MGFFSDLKDDLATAVNELMPEEEAIRTGEEEAVITPEEKIEDEAVVIPEEKRDLEPEPVVPEEEGFSLDKMLENIDSIIPEEPVKEEEIKEEIKEEVTEAPVIEEPLAEPEIVPEPVVEEVKEEPAPAVIKNESKGVKRSMESTANRMISDETSVITQGMTINGDVSSDGSIDVVGSINGNIDILGKLNVTGSILGNSKASEVFADGAKITGEIVSEGSVKIGQSSVIIGNITATSAVIAGAVKGDIDVKGPVILDTSAIVMGDIKSKSVQINNGAVIEGKCSQCYAEVNPTSFFEEFKKTAK